MGRSEDFLREMSNLVGSSGPPGKAATGFQPSNEDFPPLNLVGDCGKPSSSSSQGNKEVLSGVHYLALLLLLQPRFCIVKLLQSAMVRNLHSFLKLFMI